MKYFVVCPSCGHDLLKAENGAYVEISCPKCNDDLEVEIKNHKITIKSKQLKETKL